MSLDRSRAASFALVLAAALACRATDDGPQPERSDPLVPPPPRPWTEAFQREAVLVADEIVIEGPEGLIDHVVLRQDPETNVYTAQTISEGLLQELAVKPGTRLELRAQLDAWSLAAFKRIRVLQRPGEVPVTVSASGNAYWAAADGSGERREERLVFQGVRGR